MHFEKRSQSKTNNNNNNNNILYTFMIIIIILNLLLSFFKYTLCAIKPKLNKKEKEKQSIIEIIIFSCLIILLTIIF